MAIRNLATTYRPASFTEMSEQDAVVKILNQLLKTKKLPAAMLFCGPAGCGKTTSARIFAHDLNDGKGTPNELDAASNNGVDSVREIVNSASFRSIDSEYKCYIIDECHMLTIQGWNAFLKTLEEPPAKTLFIFCTTDPQKIPMTVLSRCQRYDFKKISYPGISRRLREILNFENEDLRYDAEGNFIADEDTYVVDNETLDYIAKLSNGGMRDAIMLLDKCLTYSPEVNIDKVNEVLGVVSYQHMFKFLQLISEKDVLELIPFIDQLFHNGVDLKIFINTFIEFLTDFNKYRLTKVFDYVKIPSHYQPILEKLASNGTNYIDILDRFMLISDQIRYSQCVKVIIESQLLLMCR